MGSWPTLRIHQIVTAAPNWTVYVLHVPPPPYTAWVGAYAVAAWGDVERQVRELCGNVGMADLGVHRDWEALIVRDVEDPVLSPASDLEGDDCVRLELVAPGDPVPDWMGDAQQAADKRNSMVAEWKKGRK